MQSLEFKSLLEEICVQQRDPVIDALLLQTQLGAKGLLCVDHATFVTSFDKKGLFMEFWKEQGLHALPPLTTKQFPAEHIALVPDIENMQTCGQMVGLSVSEDPASPINELIRRYGDNAHKDAPGILQHIAFTVDPAVSMEEVRATLESMGISFMTKILRVTSSKGSRSIAQCFTNCEKPFGPFGELIQRVGEKGYGNSPATPNDDAERLFKPEQIDELYDAYKKYSLSLIRDPE